MTLRKNHLIILGVVILVAVTIFFAFKSGILPIKTASTDEYLVDTSDMLDKEIAIEETDSPSLNLEERESLIYMREEEKLARDVYLALGETWGQPIFSNITKSEETHMAAVLGLLEKYNIPDPVASDTPGAFTQPIFQELYTNFVTKGQISRESAFEVGAEIEDLDIADLQKALTKTDNQDIKYVYQNLMKGSRNHLRAFNQQIKRSTGMSYTAHYINESTLETILTSSQERGPIR